MWPICSRIIFVREAVVERGNVTSLMVRRESNRIPGTGALRRRNSNAYSKIQKWLVLIQVSFSWPAAYSPFDGDSASEEETLSIDDMVGLRNSWSYIVSYFESKKLGFLDNKRKACEDLYRALRARELAITQLTVNDLDEKKRAVCTCALEEWRQQMLLLESDFSALYDLLESHVMVIKLGSQIAYQLHRHIRLYDEAVRKGHLPGKFRAH
jgi:hypothetical protein